MDTKFKATVYGIHKPGIGDSMFCYSGENVDFESDSLQGLEKLYRKLSLTEGTVKSIARVFQNRHLVALIAPSGVIAPNSDWLVNAQAAKNAALQNAESLKAESSILNAIRGGNLHEIEFFADPRVTEWLTPADSWFQLSLF